MGRLRAEAPLPPEKNLLERKPKDDDDEDALGLLLWLAGEAGGGGV